MTYGSVPFSLRISPLINPRNGASVLNLQYLELNCWAPNPRIISSEALSGSISRSHPPPVFVCLPALEALKDSLDNNTIATLVAWYKERGVWCEDYTGMNLTARSLLRAGLIAEDELEVGGREKGAKKIRKSGSIFLLHGQTLE